MLSKLVYTIKPLPTSSRYLIHIKYMFPDILRSRFLKLQVQLSNWFNQCKKWPQVCAHLWLKPTNRFLLPLNIYTGSPAALSLYSAMYKHAQWILYRLYTIKSFITIRIVLYSEYYTVCSIQCVITIRGVCEYYTDCMLYTVYTVPYNHTHYIIQCVITIRGVC